LDTISKFKENLYKVNARNFDAIALTLFKIQAEQNSVYRDYLKQLGVNSFSINTLEAIPFLPISFFKTHDVKTGEWHQETVFTSSGTTGATTSRHLVKDLSFYLNHSESIFKTFFGTAENYHLLALLPSYLERGGSSLVAMVNHLIKKSNSPYSGFYLSDYEELVKTILYLKQDGKKIVLWGVTFALLELAEQMAVDLSDCLVMETGGMKGRRKEIIREELHTVLKQRFNSATIASEYGMTELFSQAYSRTDGRYLCPPCMKALIRNVYDPNQLEPIGRIGIVKVIDLANADTCAFIETQDLGRLHANGYFEILGRLDNSDSRGCNLLV
jgi:phenylacetate-coenzyme A ligase PaaK-like adenylate-forming protein